MTTDDVALLTAAERAITAYLDAWDVMHLCLVNTKETTYTIMGWGVNALLAIHEDGTVWAYCRDDVNGYVGPAAGNYERIARCLAARARFANVPAV